MYDNSNAGSVSITTNKTLALADAGTQQRLTVDGLVITLPVATTVPVGTQFIIKNGGVKPTAAGPTGLGANKTLGYVITPGTGDGIAGNGITPAVNKGITYPKATGYVNDTLVLTNSGVAGATAWTISQAVSNTAEAVQFARTA